MKENSFFKHGSNNLKQTVTKKKSVIGRKYLVYEQDWPFACFLNVCYINREIYQQITVKNRKKVLKPVRLKESSFLGLGIHIKWSGHKDWLRIRTTKRIVIIKNVFEIIIIIIMIIKRRYYVTDFITIILIRHNTDIMISYSVILVTTYDISLISSWCPYIRYYSYDDIYIIVIMIRYIL